MKIAGKKIEGRNSEIIPIIRPSGNIAFIAEAIESYAEFDKLMPMPTPPEILRPGGIRESNFDDAAFKAKLGKYSEIKTAYTVIASLAGTPDLVWELVKLSDPTTYPNYQQELRDFGLTEIEINRIIQSVMKANSLDDKLIDTARQDFLRIAAQKKT